MWTEWLRRVLEPRAADEYAIRRMRREVEAVAVLGEPRDQTPPQGDTPEGSIEDPAMREPCA